jgi:hypothetical protein
MPRRRHRPRNLIRKNHHLKEPALLRLAGDDPVPLPDQLRQMPRRINRRHPFEPVIPVTMHAVRLQNGPCLPKHRRLCRPSYLRPMPAPAKAKQHADQTNNAPEQFHHPSTLTAHRLRDDPETTLAHYCPQTALSRDYLRRGPFFFERPVKIAFALASSSKTVVYL